MALAADRDLVARQYVNDYEQVFEAVEFLRSELGPQPAALIRAVTLLALTLLSKYPDSLISRKDSPEAALEVMKEAQRVLRASTGGIFHSIGWFDEWLRGLGRNPGTTADIVTASLFVALRTGIIQVPLPYPFSLTTK
jgi:triphosphoribosyl-dephospho-CoA synthase